MRILVTREGTEVIEDLENHTLNFYNKIISKKSRHKSVTQSQFYLRKNNNFNKTFRSHSTSNEKQNLFCFFSPVRNKNNQNYIDIELKSPKIEEIKNAKIHNLNLHKVNFSKAMVEKYESSPSSNIISHNNDNPLFLMKENEANNNNNNDSYRVKIFSLNEIIPYNAVRKMKIKLINDKKMKDKLSKIDESKFRSSYQERTDLEKLNEILSFPKINSNKVDLIRYLSKSKSVNINTLKNVINCSPIQINKKNKMAKMVFNEEERQKLENNIIQNKIKNNKNEENIYIHKQMINIKGQMEGFRDRLEKYKNKSDNKEKYREILKDFNMQYWNKYNFSKLNKKNKSKSINNIFNLTHLNLNKQ
jgi:hypothetical protein